MLLYQGSQFVKGNKFKDNNGAILTFEKNTKSGRLFVMENGTRIGLTESQVSKLKLLERKALGRGLDDAIKNHSTDQLTNAGLKDIFDNNSNKNNDKSNSKSDRETIKDLLSKMTFDSDEQFREFVNKIVDEIIAER